MEDEGAERYKKNPGWGDGTADATGFQRVGLMEDGFRRAPGLGLWISKK